MQIPFQGRRTRRTERLNATTNQRRWPAETIEWDRKYRTRNNWTRRSNEKTEWDHQANERIKRDKQVEPTEKWNRLRSGTDWEMELSLNDLATKWPKRAQFQERENVSNVKTQSDQARWWASRDDHRTFQIEAFEPNRTEKLVHAIWKFNQKFWFRFLIQN